MRGTCLSYKYVPNPETGEETTTVLLNHRYIYRGYLQIATCDLTRAAHPCLWPIIWDPTQPIATRPLAIQKDSTWYCYGWDLTKNICEIYSTGGYIRTVYTYTPYGEVTASGNVTQSPRGLGGGLDKPKGFAPQGRGRNGVRPSQPIQWSSEHTDTELGLVYYNYRYYNPTDGRWTRRDDDQERKDLNDYLFTKNIPSHFSDVRGLFIQNMILKAVLFIITSAVASYIGLGIEDECSLAGEVAVKRVRQTCIRTCTYSGWACCRNPEKSEIRKARYVCEQTFFGKKWKFLQWLDRNKPKPGKCENKRCADKGVECSIA